MSDFLPAADEVHEISAPAKTNLWLRILGKRADGFHEIETRMVLLEFADRIRLRPRPEGELTLQCSDPSLPTDEGNLVIKAVRALEQHTGRRFGFAIDLEKHIPHGAGLGGGSSDAAAVLTAINQLKGLGLREDELAAVGATVGSDVPFFVYGRACDCGGRGEIVTPVPDGEQPPSLRLFLYKPAFDISAAWAYRHYTTSQEYPDFAYAAQALPWGAMVNDLERPVFEKYPVLGEMKSWLRQRPGVRAALLSGSGSTVLAVLDESGDGEALRQDCRDRYGPHGWTWVGHSIQSQEGRSSR